MLPPTDPGQRGAAAAPDTRRFAMRCMLFGLVAMILWPIASAFAQAPAQARIPSADVCRLEASGTGKVRAVADGRSFFLEDGREIRLPGIEIPMPPRAGETGARAEAGVAARAALVAERGHFTVVEGKVVTVRESGGTIYVNFGRRWSQALTVTILKRNERNFVAAGLDPGRLANLRVRVRGWMEERNGAPRIEAIRPEQIEIAER
jgi:hypothetical protein